MPPHYITLYAKPPVQRYVVAHILRHAASAEVDSSYLRIHQALTHHLRTTVLGVRNDLPARGDGPSQVIHLLVGSATQDPDRNVRYRLNADLNKLFHGDLVVWTRYLRSIGYTKETSVQHFLAMYSINEEVYPLRSALRLVERWGQRDGTNRRYQRRTDRFPSSRSNSHSRP